MIASVEFYLYVPLCMIFEVMGEWNYNGDCIFRFWMRVNRMFSNFLFFFQCLFVCYSGSLHCGVFTMGFWFCCRLCTRQCIAGSRAPCWERASCDGCISTLMMWVLIYDDASIDTWRCEYALIYVDICKYWCMVMLVSIDAWWCGYCYMAMWALLHDDESIDIWWCTIYEGVAQLVERQTRNPCISIVFLIWDCFCPCCF